MYPGKPQFRHANYLEHLSVMWKKIFSNEYVRVGIVLFAFTVLMFYRPIFVTHTIIPFDIHQEFDDVVGAYTPAQNYLLSDVVSEFYPSTSFTSYAIRHGSFPFWNPHQGAGLPFYADPQTRVTELTHVLVLPFVSSPAIMSLVATLLTIWLTGFFMYAFVRNLRLPGLVAFFSAIAWMFSGPLMVWAQYPLASAAMWLPAILLLIDKLFINGDRRYIIPGVLAVAFLFFAGQPEITLIIACVAVCYAAARSVGKHFSGRRILLAVTVVICGLALAAVQWGPSFKYITSSPSYAQGRSNQSQTAFSTLVKNQLTHPKTTVKQLIVKTGTYAWPLVNPNAFGSPLDRNYRFPEQNRFNNYNEIAVYGGLMTLLAALLSLIITKRRAVMFWLAGGIVTFGLAISLPFFSWLGYLPFLNKINLGRFRFAFVFCLVMLAAYGLQWLGRKITASRLRQVFMVLCIFFVIVDLFISFSSINGGSRAVRDPLLDQSVVTQLQSTIGEQRFIGISSSGKSLSAPIMPNSATALGLDDIRVSNPVTPSEFAPVAESLNHEGKTILEKKEPSQGWLDALSVSYIVCKQKDCEGFSNFSKWETLLESPSVVVKKNGTALPRTYLAFTVQPATSTIFSDITQGKADIYQQAYVSSVRQFSLKAPDNQPIIPLALSRPNPNTVTITGTAPYDGIAVLTDLNMAGWSAYSAGTKVPIVTVNGFARGIYVQKGTISIRFNYLPPHLLLFTIISLLGLVGTIVLVISLRKK
jgi:hypothetical protein